MLKMRAEIVQAVKAAKEGPDLFEFLQNAIKLEHSTIPPYLTALYSIKSDTNEAAAEIIRTIVVEEMLHMTIVANVLNAIGGSPAIDHCEFIPTYPGPLPMMVDDLQVGLEKLSKELIGDKFMRIEQPEDPKHFPSAAATLSVEKQEFSTIGQFYDAIIEKVEAMGPSIFVGDPSRQVVDNDWFPPDQLFSISDPERARRALTIIKDQGEGTHENPLEASGLAAHYYRFEEIVRGKTLVKDSNVKEGFSFSGDVVPFDPSGIIDIVSNSRAAMYTAGSLARDGVDLANGVYTRLLRALHETFNGKPDKLSTSLGVMNEFRLVVLEKVVSVRVDGSEKFAAPAFEFVPVPNT